MARRFRTILRGGRPVRETLWFGMTETRTVTNGANAAAIILSLNAAALALRPFTIVRSLMHYSIRSDQTAASENFGSALAGAVVSDQAVAIGITAVPTPFTDLGSDLFFLHHIMDGQFLFISGIGVDPNGVAPAGGTLIESKAMRKVENGQDLIFVLENDSLQASGVTSYVAGRVLVKLH